MADAKTQAFAHRLVEFADYDKCIQYFTERGVDFDHPNDSGWSVLMSVCACGRDDLVGFVLDRTTAVNCATTANHTTVLHLAAMSKNERVMQELMATSERRTKLQAVVEQTNAHGDTALMMACVAKSVAAVELLIQLGASLSAVNASGLNALMCAARACDDPRPGAPTHEELIARSATIVKALLAHGADVNAVEAAGGNTALHLAVLSENTDAVECLLENAPEIDVTWRNEVGNTALDMSNHISGVAAAKIGDLLRSKWAQCEEEAAQMSAQVEQELLSLSVKDAEDASKPSSTKSGKKKSKKTKKKAKASITNESALNNSSAAEDQASDVILLEETEDAGASSTSPEAPPNTQQTSIQDSTDEDGGDWQSVVPKKSRRKESIGDKAHANHHSKKPQRKGAAKPKKQKGPTKPVPTPPRTKPDIDAVGRIPSSPLKSPWGKQADAKDSPSFSPQSQEGSVDEETASAASDISYDTLNGSFQRTFPVAADLEIGVEKFLIASSASDRELEPNDSLSISQVEALQEAHWQAYHYLNEKKIELTRVLEAQRVEAQFTLQQELMQMK